MLYCRDDYKELLELSLIFLDDFPKNKQISFKRPGATYHARWMAKAMLKIFIFREQFSLTAREIHSSREVCIFIILFYIKSWFTSSTAILAPNNDLELIKELTLYKTKNAVV